MSYSRFCTDHALPAQIRIIACEDVDGARQFAQVILDALSRAIKPISPSRSLSENCGDHCATANSRAPLRMPASSALESL